MTVRTKRWIVAVATLALLGAIALAIATTGLVYPTILLLEKLISYPYTLSILRATAFNWGLGLLGASLFTFFSPIIPRIIIRIKEKFRARADRAERDRVIAVVAEEKKSIVEEKDEYDEKEEKRPAEERNKILAELQDRTNEARKTANNIDTSLEAIQYYLDTWADIKNEINPKQDEKRIGPKRSEQWIKEAIKGNRPKFENALKDIEEQVKIATAIRDRLIATYRAAAQLQPRPNAELSTAEIIGKILDTNIANLSKRYPELSATLAEMPQYPEDNKAEEEHPLPSHDNSAKLEERKDIPANNDDEKLALEDNKDEQKYPLPSHNDSARLEERKVIPAINDNEKLAKLGTSAWDFIGPLNIAITTANNDIRQLAEARSLNKELRVKTLREGIKNLQQGEIAIRKNLADTEAISKEIETYPNSLLEQLPRRPRNGVRRLRITKETATDTLEKISLELTRIQYDLENLVAEKNDVTDNDVSSDIDNAEETTSVFARICEQAKQMEEQKRLNDEKKALLPEATPQDENIHHESKEKVDNDDQLYISDDEDENKEVMDIFEGINSDLEKEEAAKEEENAGIEPLSPLSSTSDSSDSDKKSDSPPSSPSPEPLDQKQLSSALQAISVNLLQPQTKQKNPEHSEENETALNLVDLNRETKG